MFNKILPYQALGLLITVCSFVYPSSSSSSSSSAPVAPSSSSSSLRRSPLTTLPSGIVTAIRAHLINDQWPAFKELVKLTLSPARARQIAPHVQSFQLLFPDRLDKTRITHPHYGTVSFINKPLEDNKHTVSLILTQGTNKREHTMHSMNGWVVKAYFVNTIIIVEYQGSVGGTRVNRFAIFDPETLRPILPLTELLIPHKVAIESFFYTTTLTTDEVDYYGHTMPGAPLACSPDNRFVFTWIKWGKNDETSFIFDCKTKSCIKVKKAVKPLSDGHIPVYTIPNTSKLLVDFGNRITIFDYDRQVRIAQYTLPAGHTLLGYVARPTTPKIAPETLWTHNNPLVIVDLTTTPITTSLLILKDPSLLCLAYDGITSEALTLRWDGTCPPEKPIDCIPVFKRYIHAYQVRIPTEAELRATSNTLNKYPYLVRRYLKSISNSLDHLTGLALRLNADTLPLAITLSSYIENSSLETSSLEREVIEQITASYIGESKNDGAIKSDTMLMEELCKKYPSLKDPQAKKLLTTCMNRIKTVRS